METATEVRRPYAPSANVVAVLHRARTRNLPPHVDEAFFNIADVPKSAHGLVRETLLFLGLIDPEGSPSTTFEQISSASDGEFQAILGQVVRQAYADDFAVVDPSKDSAETLINNFRRYKPRSVTDRMRMLFTGLCREAGIPVAEKQKERRASPKQPRRAPRKQTPASEVPTQVAPKAATPQQAEISVPISHADIVALSDEAAFLKIWDSLGRLEWSRAMASAPKAPVRADERKQLGPGLDATEN